MYKPITNGDTGRDAEEYIKVRGRACPQSLTATWAERRLDWLTTDILLHILASLLLESNEIGLLVTSQIIGGSLSRHLNGSMNSLK